jgi:hypothetical protein
MTSAERQEATRYIEHQMQTGRKPADIIAALERRTRAGDSAQDRQRQRDDMAAAGTGTTAGGELI